MVVKTSKWSTEIIGLKHGIYHAHAVMDDSYVASALYGINRENGSLLWQAEPTGWRNSMEPFGIHRGILVTRLQDQGSWRYPGRFDIDTGKPLFMERPNTFIGRWQQRKDVRDLITFESSFSPLFFRSNTIVSEGGCVFDLSSGRMNSERLEITPAQEMEIVPLSNQLMRQKRLLLKGLGVLEQSGSCYSEAYQWSFSDLSGRLIWREYFLDLAHLDGKTCHITYKGQFEIDPPYAYFVAFKPASSKPDAFDPAYYSLIVVDLRKGSTVKSIPVTDVPIKLLTIDAIDNKGILLSYVMYGRDKEMSSWSDEPVSRQIVYYEKESPLNGDFRAS